MCLMHMCCFYFYGITFSQENSEPVVVYVVNHICFPHWELNCLVCIR